MDVEGLFEAANERILSVCECVCVFRDTKIRGLGSTRAWHDIWQRREGAPPRFSSSILSERGFTRGRCRVTHALSRSIFPLHSLRCQVPQRRFVGGGGRLSLSTIRHRRGRNRSSPRSCASSCCGLARGWRMEERSGKMRLTPGERRVSLYSVCPGRWARWERRHRDEGLWHYGK